MKIGCRIGSTALPNPCSICFISTAKSNILGASIASHFSHKFLLHLHRHNIPLEFIYSLIADKSKPKFCSEGKKKKPTATPVFISLVLTRGAVKVNLVSVPFFVSSSQFKRTGMKLCWKRAVLYLKELNDGWPPAIS